VSDGRSPAASNHTSAVIATTSTVPSNFFGNFFRFTLDLFHLLGSLLLTSNRSFSLFGLSRFYRGNRFFLPDSVVTGS